ncbi:MAG: sigma-54-dependent Fis family transcriptional regulator [Deltaproteobacteria bacterium]|nr:sigma-54-dependent Fis family transcriptional regulator [Deltaproteobacteria bacterium]
MPPDRLLIVDDDILVCDSLRELFTLEGFRVDTALDGAEALARLKNDDYQVVLSDIQMPRLNGMELLREIKGLRPGTQVIFITGHGNIDGAVEAIKLGAYDYITKPIDDVRLRLTVQRALEQQKLLVSYESLKQRLKPWDLQDTLLFRDRRMEKLLETVHAIADTLATVLITGESGTGKSLLARYIHEHSTRRGRPFVKISCGSLAETLLESELFGHVRGAFTGAIRDKKGKFEAAHGGTVFLDDVNSASPGLQVKLLRVLQEKVIERVGGNSPIPTDVRIITATNTSLKDEVAAQNFREDLYYRINVVSLTLPPLRERLADIEPLVQHFLRQFNALHRRKVKGLSRSALQLLLRHSWPGNVRELENVIEQAVILCPGDYLVPDSLPSYIKGANLTAPSAPPGDLTLDEALAQAEKHILLEALERFKWNRQMTSRALGVSRTTLFNKMRRFRLTDPRRQPPAPRPASAISQDAPLH